SPAQSLIFAAAQVQEHGGVLQGAGTHMRLKDMAAHRSISAASQRCGAARRRTFIDGPGNQISISTRNGNSSVASGSNPPMNEFPFVTAKTLPSDASLLMTLSSLTNSPP